MFVQTLQESAVIRVVGCDPQPAASGQAASLGIGLAADFDAILTDHGNDAIILCTPHTQHPGQIQAAGAVGKHVFCEKPLCLTLAAVAAYRRNGVTLGVGHERRFEPPVLALRQLVEDGGLGTLLQTEGNFS